MPTSIGWHSDPSRQGWERYWDGTEWSKTRPVGASDAKPPRQRSAAAAPLWVIAGLLAVVIVAGGVMLLHKHQVAAQRDKYREQAQLYCTLSGVAPDDAGESYLHSAQFKRCTEDQIDTLIAEHN